MFDFLKKKDKSKAPAGAPAQNGSAAGSEEQTPFYFSSPLGQVRYEIEHKVLRDQLFSNTLQIMAAVVSENGLYGIYDACFTTAGMKNPYQPGDFKAEGGRIDDNHIMAFLELPKPEFTPLCYRIYFLCGTDGSNPAMYTIERGVTGGFLCGWRGEQHLNFHELKNPEFKEGAGMMKAIETKIIIDMYNGRN